MTKPRKRCALCGKNPAVLPDREKPGKPGEQICRPCHARRLLGDLHRIMKTRPGILK